MDSGSRRHASPSLVWAGVVTSVFAALLWWIKVFETSFGWNLGGLGVYPLSSAGLIGILTAPLIHGSWEHLIANTLPLLLLGTALIYGYPKSRWWTLAVIWIVSGTGVWLLGRQSFHIGASGITHGMMFFLFISGIIRRDKRSIALSMLAFFMYGGMLMTIFPRDPGISFEYHFFGAVGGVLCAMLFRRWDPKPVRKMYSWDREPEDHEDPLIGELWKKKPGDYEMLEPKPDIELIRRDERKE